MNKADKLKIKQTLIILTFVLEFIICGIFMPGAVVSAAADSETVFCVAVDYYAEKIRIINPNSLIGRYGDYSYVEIADNESVISGVSAGIGKSDLAENISIARDGEYMYSLKVVSDEILNSYVSSGKPEKKTTALLNEKWYPIYGGSIDIKSIIPTKVQKNTRKQYYIAIRKADDYFDTETGYKSRVSVCIKPRYSEKNLNKFIEYDAVREKIILSSSYPDGSSLNIIYRYDYFNSLSGTLSKDVSDSGVNIDASGKLFSEGGYVYVSSMPFIKDGAYGTEVTFARSKEIKVRIPRVPNVPALKADLTVKKITSMKKGTLEWSLTGGDNSAEWRPYEKVETTLPFTDVLKTFPGLNENNMDENGNYIIYFRTKAVQNKSPVSLPKKILIPANMC